MVDSSAKLFFCTLEKKGESLKTVDLRKEEATFFKSTWTPQRGEAFSPDQWEQSLARLRRKRQK